MKKKGTMIALFDIILAVVLLVGSFILIGLIMERGRLVPLYYEERTYTQVAVSLLKSCLKRKDFLEALFMERYQDAYNIMIELLPKGYYCSLVIKENDTILRFGKRPRVIYGEASFYSFDVSDSNRYVLLRVQVWRE